MRFTLLDIGNTHTRIAVTEADGRIELLRSCRSSELSSDWLPPGLPVLAASVNPAAARRLTGVEIKFISAADCGGLLDFSLVDGSTVGADRVANAAALVATGPLPALSVDCGTAITIEAVDERRRFRGGAIAPGRRLMFDSLSGGTAQLPAVFCGVSAPFEVGCDTASAIRFGVERGAVGMVRELLAVAVGQFSPRRVVLTGGDADFFAASLPELERAADDFTLRGLWYALNHQPEEREK